MLFQSETVSLPKTRYLAPKIRRILKPRGGLKIQQKRKFQNLLTAERDFSATETALKRSSMVEINVSSLV